MSNRHFHLADLFEAVADAVPEREAVVYGPRRLTFHEMDERATRLAHYLQAQGVAPRGAGPGGGAVCGSGPLARAR